MEEIINNIMQSPENTNPNILRSQLQNIGDGGGGAVYATFTKSGDTWSCDKTAAELKAAYEAGKALIANIEYTWIVPMIMLDYGSIQFFEASAVSVNGLSMQTDKFRIDTVHLSYYTQDGTDSVEVNINTWTVDATVYNGA